jgi:hypothetical protein
MKFKSSRLFLVRWADDVEILLITISKKRRLSVPMGWRITQRTSANGGDRSL